MFVATPSSRLEAAKKGWIGCERVKEGPLGALEKKGAMSMDLGGWIERTGWVEGGGDGKRDKALACKYVF